MKVNCLFLITRLNGKIVDVVPLQDIYTNCSINLESEYLTDEDIIKVWSHMDKEYQTKEIACARRNGNLYREDEAKELTYDLSSYSIRIEDKDIEFK